VIERLTDEMRNVVRNLRTEEYLDDADGEERVSGV